MAEYFNVTTNLGDAEVANAIATNTKIEITHIAFGDGNGSVPTPSKSRTALVREVHRQAVTKYERHDTNPNWIVIETIIPSNIGGFTVREIGVIGNGKLISHGNHAPFEKVADPTGVSEYRLKFTQNITDGNVVSITLDESLIFATQAWVEENYIKRSEIVDNLTTDDPSKPISAKQAKKLQDNKLDKEENAVSASKLNNKVKLNGADFDGSTNVSVPALSTAILANADLNDYSTPGFYYCEYSGTAATIANKAFNSAFSLLVERAATVKQTFTHYYTGLTAIRMFDFENSTWTPWKDVAFTDSNITGTSKNITGVAAIANGGTGATTFEQAKANLGITGNIHSVLTTESLNNLRHMGSVLFYQGTGANATTARNYPMGGSGFYIQQIGNATSQGATTTNTIQEATSFSSGTVRKWIRFTDYGNTNWRSWLEYYTTSNTTVDANGFIKKASPIVNLFADRIELNDEAKQQHITFEKLGIGDYLLKGSTGFAQESWYIEQPKDANGNVYHAVVYEQLKNGDLSIKTYEQKLEDTRIVADLEKPIDVKDGRFISIRLNELPEDPIAPINPTVTDNEGNTAPSKYHVLEDGVWTISSDDELRMAQEKRALFAKLSKRQFALYMYDNNMYDQVMQAIEANPRFKIEYDAVSDIERLSPTVLEMTLLLDWTEDQVDQMWAEALKL